MASHPGIVIRALSWNLLHGRDAPPGPPPQGWRSLLLRRPERGETHVQVNASLGELFASRLAAWEWDLALLQEAPPRWLVPLADRSRASGQTALTARNQLSGLRSALGRRNPDLIRSSEGGSNMVLIRPPWRLLERERITLTRLPERRRLLLVRLCGTGGLTVAVACTHLSVPATGQAPGEALFAAALAKEWADGDPLILGGDLNLRPAREPEVFEALEGRFGLRRPTAPQSLDHLLVRELSILSPPAPMADEERDVPWRDGLAIRLSDHAPVAAVYGVA